jgi:hypothetical protein
VIAVSYTERINAIGELVKWASIESQARDRQEHSVASAAGKRMREVVKILGFDPLTYEPGRDGAELLIRGRALRMLRAMPGPTADVAKAAGVPSSYVRQYLMAYVMSGEVRCERRGTAMWWEVTP